MDRIIIKILVLILLLTGYLSGGQKSVNMSASATDMFKNDAFELEIKFENFESNISVQYPSFDDLITISGPFQSSSTSVINGAVTKSLVLTYQLAPKKTGKIKIEPAVVTEGVKTYKSNEIVINVHEQGQSADGSSGGKEMFILAEISSKNVYVGEMLKIDYILYIKPDIKISMPSLSAEPKFTNFIKELIQLSQDQTRTLTQTIYKNQKYNTLPLRSYWLSPTSSGENTIEPLSVIVPVEVKAKRRKNSDPFFDDPFFSNDIFSGFSNYQEKSILSEEVKITVNSLPNEGKPSDFAGALGSYKLSTSIDRDSVQVNEAVNLKITISGRGNLNDITVIRPDIPKDFEVYDPKRTVIFDKDSKNSGRVVFEYLLLARVPGKYKINNISFSYFDLSDKKYKILESSGHFVSVGGEVSQVAGGTGFARRDVEVLASDIRYIKKNIGAFYAKDKKELSAAEFLLYFITSALLLFISFLSRYMISKSSGNLAHSRYRKAVKNAMKRLRNSYKSLEKKDPMGFYKNLDEALLKFIADKFNISHAGIIVDEISSELKEKGVDDEILNKMKKLLNKSASIQFAPVKPDIAEMSTDITETKDLMISINERLK